MSRSSVLPTQSTGSSIPPLLYPNNTFMGSKGLPEFKTRIFSDLNKLNFSGDLDPATQARLAASIQPDMQTIRPGLFIHIGQIPPQVHKAALEKKYEMTTECVDELQMKWQQLRAQSAQECGESLPDPTDPNTPFDPLDPDNRVWNDFYYNNLYGVLAEIFAKALSDRATLMHLMETVHEFWKAVQQKRSVAKRDPEVIRYLGLILCNEPLSRDPGLFDFVELLFRGTRLPFEPLTARLTTEENKAYRVLADEEGDMVSWANAVGYVKDLVIVWLRDLIYADKRSPCSDRRHLTVALAVIPSFEAFPSYTPPETFKQRFAEYSHGLFSFVDWMRIKLGREDYMLRLMCAHQTLHGLPEQMTEQEIGAFLADPGNDDKFVEVLCTIWIELGIKPEPWMMHFSNSEESIRQEARDRAEVASKEMVSLLDGFYKRVGLQ